MSFFSFNYHSLENSKVLRNLSDISDLYFEIIFSYIISGIRFKNLNLLGSKSLFKITSRKGSIFWWKFREKVALGITLNYPRRLYRILCKRCIENFEFRGVVMGVAIFVCCRRVKQSYLSDNRLTTSHHVIKIWSTLWSTWG